MYIYICIYTYIYIYIYVCVCVYIYVCVGLCMCVCVYKYVCVGVLSVHQGILTHRVPTRWVSIPWLTPPLQIGTQYQSLNLMTNFWEKGAATPKSVPSTKYWIIIFWKIGHTTSIRPN